MYTLDHVGFKEVKLKVKSEFTEIDAIIMEDADSIIYNKMNKKAIIQLVKNSKYSKIACK